MVRFDGVVLLSEHHGPSPGSDRDVGVFTWRHHAYLAPLLAVERAASVPPAAGAPEPAARVDKSAWDRLAVLRAFVGDTDGAISVKDRADGAQRGGQAAALQIGDGVTAQNAIDAIVEQARGRRVVLINENHHVPMHRAFTRKLAAAPRKIGYRYLACETFNSADGDMRASTPGYVSERTGTYTRDPVFAGMVNAALADGWQLVPYEYEMMPTPGQSPRQRLEERELGQARKLVERIFAKDKNAKVLIHVGNHHLAKSLPGDTALPVMMGEHLRRLLVSTCCTSTRRRFTRIPTPGRNGRRMRA